MKKLLKKHFAKFEEGQDEISPQLLETIYALEKKEERTIKSSFNYKHFSIRLAPFIIIISLTIPLGIKLFNNDTDPTEAPTPSGDQYVTPTDANNESLALSRNGNLNIAKALVMAVDDYKENNNKNVSATNNYTSYLSTMNLNTKKDKSIINQSVTNNYISYLSTKNLSMNLNNTEEQDINQDSDPLLTYDFEFVDFYDTYEFYVDVELENDFTENFEDTHFRVLISNVDLYIDDMTVWNSEGIIVLINQTGQIISYLTDGDSFDEGVVELEFSNHKWLDGNDVVKDIDVSPHYTFTLNTNYDDRFNLTYTQYESKYTNQTDQFSFTTVKDSYYKVEDRIMFDLKNLTDRVVTVTFLELTDENKFTFEYKGNIYYCLFDESTLDEETLEVLPTVNTLTIIFDGYFIGDNLDTISAQKITIESYKEQEPNEHTTETTEETTD